MPTPDPAPARLTLEHAVAIAYALGRTVPSERDAIADTLNEDFDTLMRRIAFDGPYPYAAPETVGIALTTAERTLIREHVDTYLPDGPLKTSIFDAIPDPTA